MNVRRAIAFSGTALLLSAAAALAGGIAPGGPQPATQVGPSHGRPAWRATTHLVDEGTGAVLRVKRLPSGALQFDIEGDHLQVRKTTQANGDFDLGLRSDGDAVAVIRRGDLVRVSRRDRSVDFGAAAFVEGELNQLQELLAGSDAIRRFRALKSGLAPATRATGLGTAVEVIDLAIGALKGESPAPISGMPGPGGSGPMTASAMSDLEEVDTTSCYQNWVVEIVAAWYDYEGCVYSFAWYNPYREVCAFAWIIRVESAWFRLIACSSFPLKLDACHAESGDIPD